MKIITGLLFRLPLGLVVLFIATAVIRTAILMPLDFSRSGVFFPFLIGLGGGLVFFSLLWKFRVVYIFGHELTHYMMAKIFRRRTGKFRIGLNSGSVEIENPNIWITLSPYFIPLYTLLWSGTYFTLRQLQPALLTDIAYLAIAGIGVTYAYHLTMTGYALTREQADLKIHGGAFSLCIILFVNILIIFIGILAVTGQWRYGTATLWQILVEQAQLLWYWADRFFLRQQLHEPIG